MKQLKFLFFILLATMIISCDSTNKPDDGGIELLPTGDFWEYMGGSPTGIRQIAVASNGDIWVASRSGGIFAVPERTTTEIYLSTNNGNSWVNKGNINIYPYPNSRMTVSPINGYVFIPTAEGLFRSTDKGNNWVNITESTTPIHNILITPSGEIYCAHIDDRVSYSSDNGNTWTYKSNGFAPNTSILSLHIGKDGTLYTTAMYSVYRSTDGGDTWIATSWTSNELLLCPLYLTVSDDGSLFLTTSYGDILKSTDKGTNWTQIHSRSTDYSYYLGVHSFICNPITNDMFFTECYGHDLRFDTLTNYIYKSSDSGANWELVTDDGIPNDALIWTFAFNPNTGQMYASNTEGFYRYKSYAR